MSCFGCYFYKSDCMWNRCDYFESECFSALDMCKAFSLDGKVSPEIEQEIFAETGGAFGKPMEDGK